MGGLVCARFRKLDGSVERVSLDAAQTDPEASAASIEELGRKGIAGWISSARGGTVPPLSLGRDDDDNGMALMVAPL